MTIRPLPPEGSSFQAALGALREGFLEELSGHQETMRVRFDMGHNFRDRQREKMDREVRDGGQDLTAPVGERRASCSDGPDHLSVRASASEHQLAL